jgi:hypothetical protein
MFFICSFLWALIQLFGIAFSLFAMWGAWAILNKIRKDVVQYAEDLKQSVKDISKK